LEGSFLLDPPFSEAARSLGNRLPSQQQAKNKTTGREYQTKKSTGDGHVRNGKRRSVWFFGRKKKKTTKKKPHIRDGRLAVLGSCEPLVRE
jgi:hypothetical protein